MGKIWMPGGGGGADLDVVTAGSGDVLPGKVIVDKEGDLVIGTMPSMGGQTVNPTASQQTVSTSGKYMTGNVIVNGVTNLTAANIREGVNVGGTVGSMKDYSYLAVGQTSF